MIKDVIYRYKGYKIFILNYIYNISMRDPKKSLNSLELFVKEDLKFKRLVKQSVAAHKLGISPFTLRAYLTRNQRPYRVFKTQIQNWLLEEEIDEDIQKRNENKKGL